MDKQSEFVSFATIYCEKLELITILSFSKQSSNEFFL